MSGVARKGARLLRFLLDKDRQVEEQRLDRSQAKRPRQPTDPQSQLARALAPPTLAQFAPTPPEDVSLPHKRKTSTKSSASSMLRTPTEPSFSFEPPPIPIPAPGDDGQGLAPAGLGRRGERCQRARSALSAGLATWGLAQHVD